MQDVAQEEYTDEGGMVVVVGGLNCTSEAQ